MKRIIFLLLTCIMYSCSNTDTCKENDVVKNRFNFYINSINNYDLYRGVITDSLLANFGFSAEVLSDLTGEEHSYIFAEPPSYKTRKDCLSDIKKYKKWYNENKCKITIEKLDSIEKNVYSKRIWW